MIAMRIQFSKVSAWLVLAACGCALVAGCGGGASTKPTVKIKPVAKSDGASQQATGGNNGGAQAAAGGIGSWKGKVVFKGTPRQLPPLVEQGAQIKDPQVCAVQTIPDQKLIVGADGGVANVFVFLQRAPKGASVPPPPQEPILFDQKFCTFLPHALFVRSGQTLNITNSDRISHNTHTYPQKNSTFNQAVDFQLVVPIVYQQPELEPVEVKCDIHAWMRAYHLTLDHPFAAVTGGDGSFEIKDIPAGAHKFQVWHEGAQGGYIVRNLEVKIAADQVTEQNIDYPEAKFASTAEPATKVVEISSLLKQ